MGVGLCVTSAIGLLLFVGAYRHGLEQERSAASTAVNLLLQSSLENAMLKQDLGGLREIITKLGEQPNIRAVFIANPAQQIRFASQPNLLGQRIEWLNHTLPQQVDTFFWTTPNGEEILRSVNPVYNKPPCTVCHGELEDHPINGVLFVDYAAEPLRQKAFYNGFLFVMAALGVMLLMSASLWWFMRQFVLKPLQHLTVSVQSLADGDLNTRASLSSHNELGELANGFNEMAESLQARMQEIYEKEDFLQALIDAIPDGLRVINPQNHQLLMYNRAYAQQLNIGKNTDILKTCYESSYARATPCQSTLITCPLHEIAKHHRATKFLTHHVRSDGSQLEVEVFAAPLRVRINQQFFELIVESVRDVRQTLTYSHAQKLAEMGQLAAGVAHEIHNPLSSVRLALQSLLKSLRNGQTDPPRMESYLKLVDSEIDKCIAVTHRLLKLSSPSGERQLVDLDIATQETLSLLQYESENRQITISFQSEEGLHRVLAQEHDIRMIILNLVQNAFHAMPKGGNLIVTIKRLNNQIYLTIQDNGRGIPEENLSKIFDPFFSHRADGIRGTGLGLSICKNLIEQYGGTISATSIIQQGSCFVVQLPDAQTLYFKKRE
jgi:signal transduction histidine kinase